MTTWRDDDSPALHVHGVHASYKIELWYRDDKPDHVTVSGDDADEVTIHVNDLYDLAEALHEIAAEADQ